MSDPIPHLEELAALHALGILDEAGQKELQNARGSNPEIEQLALDYAETAAWLAHEAPEAKPPPDLKKTILGQLPTGRIAFPAKLITLWLPYAIAACLMLIGIGQTKLILRLQSQIQPLRSEVSVLRQSNELMQLRLTTLDAKDPSYLSAKVLVAWDPHTRRGFASLGNLPAPPDGHDYQLWVLDPGAEAPLSAGVIAADAASHRFAVPALTTDNPGFAVSLEPSGGRPAPTGAILFAIAPASP